MDKLYSRGKRFRVPQGTKLVIDKKPNKQEEKLKRKNKRVITVIAVFVIAFLVLYRSVRIIEPVFYEVATNAVKGIAVKISSNVSKEVMGEYDYTDLITVHKDDENNVTMIETNIININKIQAQIAGRMQEEIEKISNDDINLAMGSFTGVKIFIGKGPRIPIKIVHIGDVETEYISQFKSAGINQTNHQICLNIKCNVGIMSSFETVTRSLETQVVLAENIIVGNVPESYYNFEGLDENESLNMLQ